ncbi:MAG: MerR family transcriptional regulator [Thermomicrobiales bacterium]
MRQERESVAAVPAPVAEAMLGQPASGSAPVPPSSALARFYMTSDLRAATGLTRTHLDFYLRENVIVPTARTESGYLLFDDDELSVLRQVIAWRQNGVGVREIRMRLGRASEADINGGRP